MTTYDNFAALVAGTPSQTVQYGYDFLNRLISRTLDADGSGAAPPSPNTSSTTATRWRPTRSCATSPPARRPPPIGPDPAIDLGQVVLQLDENGSPTHRYLWGQAVDHILADETVDDGDSNTLWLLTDHQNTVRDIVKYDDVKRNGPSPITSPTKRSAASFLETAPAVNCSFGHTARYLDAATELAYHGHRSRTCTTPPG